MWWTQVLAKSKQFLKWESDRFLEQTRHLFSSVTAWTNYSLIRLCSFQNFGQTHYSKLLRRYNTGTNTRPQNLLLTINGWLRQQLWNKPTWQNTKARIHALWIKWKTRLYHTVETIPKFIREVVETEAKAISSNICIHDRPLSWLCTGNVWIKLVSWSQATTPREWCGHAR